MHLTDYIIIVKQSDKSYIRANKAICRANCWTDHGHTIFRLNLKIQSRGRFEGTKSKKKLTVTNLLIIETKDKLSCEIISALKYSDPIPEDVELCW